MLRIAIVGPQGSGKSTLSTRLAQELDLPLIEEVARGVARVLSISQDDPQLRPELRYFWQLGILLAQCKAEKEQEQFVSDRSVIDNAGYFKLLIERFPEHLSPELVALYGDLCRRQISQYSHLFYMPSAGTAGLVNDKFRNTDVDYQVQVDQAMRKVLEDFGAQERVTFVPADLSWEEKYQFVLERCR